MEAERYSNGVALECLTGWPAAVDYFKHKMAGKHVVFIADKACTPALGLYLSQAKLPVRFAVLYGRAVGMSKSIAAQQARAADWLFVGANAEAANGLGWLTDLLPTLKAVRVLVANAEFTTAAGFDFCVMANQSLTLAADNCERQVNLESYEVAIAPGYKLVNASTARLQNLKERIAHTYAERAQLKADMEAWYQAGKGLRFPKRLELEAIDNHLSQLDSAYKRLWDANQ